MRHGSGACQAEAILVKRRAVIMVVAQDREQYSGVHTRHRIGTYRTKGDLGKKNCYIVVARGRDNWMRVTWKWCVLDTERDDLVYICNRTDIY
jgi:hypothetical protein